MTESQWKDVDEAFIKKMDAVDSHKLVDLLWNGDDDAWRYVYARAVLPLLKRASLGRIVQDRNRSDLDICGAVFEYLIGKRKLELYRHECPIVYWIRFWVTKDILGYCKKNDNPVSEEERKDVSIDETPFDGVAFKDEIKFCYMKLLHENRKEANVLYLKAVEGRSSQEIMMLLGISSEANVDQMHSRARKKMRQYLEESRRVKASPMKKDEMMEVLA